MAVSKLHILLLSFLFALIFTQIRADDAGDGVAAGSDDSKAFQIELDKLASEIQSLESLVHENTLFLRIGDKIIAEKEKTINEKLDSITSSRGVVASLKFKWSSDAMELVLMASTISQELEKQVEKLRLELDLKASLREALEIRSKELEKKMLEINPKIQNLQQTIKEQKPKLHKIDRALEVAEEELMKNKIKATQKNKVFTEVDALRGYYSPWLL